MGVAWGVAWLGIPKLGLGMGREALGMGWETLGMAALVGGERREISFGAAKFGSWRASAAAPFWPLADNARATLHDE
jgi:hypothetical protein